MKSNKSNNYFFADFANLAYKKIYIFPLTFVIFLTITLVFKLYKSYFAELKFEIITEIDVYIPSQNPRDILSFDGFKLELKDFILKDFAKSRREIKKISCSQENKYVNCSIDLYTKDAEYIRDQVIEEINHTKIRKLERLITQITSVNKIIEQTDIQNNLILKDQIRELSKQYVSKKGEGAIEKYYLEKVLEVYKNTNTPNNMSNEAILSRLDNQIIKYLDNVVSLYNSTSMRKFGMNTFIVNNLQNEKMKPIMTTKDIRIYNNEFFLSFGTIVFILLSSILSSFLIIVMIWKL